MPQTTISAEPRRSTKATITVDGDWIDIETIRIRQGDGEIEIPADGSQNLREATARARAHLALARVFPKCSDGERLPPALGRR